MNRRGFLAGLAIAPLALSVPSPKKRVFATGGALKPRRYIVGEIGPELIMPPNTAIRQWGKHIEAMTVRR